MRYTSRLATDIQPRSVRNATFKGAILVLSTFVVGACNQAVPTVNRVQTSLVEKKMFQGEWWYAQTLIDVDTDAAAAAPGVFQGEMPWADLGVDQGASGSVARIRWVIDEKYLFAYRAYELLDGANADAKKVDFRGEPVAAFKVERHVDVRRGYNEVTGETTNVTEENTTDRKWYERAFMRVDWSHNLIDSFVQISMELGPLRALGYKRESVPFFFQEGAHKDFPRSWQPQFIKIGDDPSYRFRDEWPAGTENDVHYMSIVAQVMFSPGTDGACLALGVPCQTVSLPLRHSFLRVPPKHEYVTATQTHDEFDRFGVFRSEQSTYTRGGEDHEVLHKRCDFDEDCGQRGVCDQNRHFCVGGLSEDVGQTDFLTFLRPRLNVWKNSLSQVSCVEDWECDGRYEDTRGVGAGSTCDRRTHQCSIPPKMRSTRQVVFTLNAGYPSHLVPAAFEVVGDWNEAFMRGVRLTRGKPLPRGPEAISCQSLDPTRYCYCDSARGFFAPEVRADGTCAWRYDPFIAPSAATTSGVINPYNCYIKAPLWNEAAHPESYADYPLPDVYRFEFAHEASLGESECLLLLRANACDKWRTDASKSCDQVLDDQGEPVAYEALGDIRYHFFNYVNHGAVMFGGVSLPLADPKTGELVVANANVAAESIERMGTHALEFFPVLRREPGAEQRYFSGENLRGYFDRLGRTEAPVGVAISGDGYSVSDPSRPTLSAGFPADLHSHLLSSSTKAFAKIENLQGPAGRLQIRSDRIATLSNTPLESRFVSALGPNGVDALVLTHPFRALVPDSLANASISTQPTSVLDSSILDRVSPFRDGFVENLLLEADMWSRLSARNYDPPIEPEFQSRFLNYWAEAFRGHSGAEASIRMQQALLRATMHHEMGHSVGLRHNFAGSLDRDHYADGYFRVARELPLPLIAEFDSAVRGGNEDDVVNGEEMNRYLAELRRVRDARAARGIGNTMSSSVMDYAGDLSDFASGLGRYDVAATLWNYFDKVEAFTRDPRLTAPNTSLDQMAQSDRVERTWWTYYRGGESCHLDSDCPHAAGRQTILGQPLFQKCVRNLREVTLQVPCNGNRNCTCSTFDEDFHDYVDGVGYDNDTDRDGSVDAWPVSYLFCPDERTNDISWCSRFDVGESFQEVLDHYRRRWQESYPLSYFRRFQRNGARGGTSLDFVANATKIYQHLYFRFVFEPGFSSNRGPLGFDDQYLASVDALNWFIEIANLPGTGSYQCDNTTQVCKRLGESLALPGSNLDLAPGAGFAMWSQYQDGYYGFFRQERSGVFYDKLFAMFALANRDWGLRFTVDERFYINFFDLFPVEVTEYFGGVILDNPKWFAPRVTMRNGSSEPEITHMTWFRDVCTEGGVQRPCRGSQEETYPLGPISGSGGTAQRYALDGTSNEVLRDWAAILALAHFPVFYDTTFEQRLSVFKLANGDGFRIPNVQPNGSPTCFYGGPPVDSSHVSGCTDPDYVVYNSRRLHTPYVAVKVRARLAYNLPEEQLGFELLRNMVDVQNRIRTLEALPAPSKAETQELNTLSDKLQEDESFVEYLIELQRRYGISSYL